MASARVVERTAAVRAVRMELLPEPSFGAAYLLSKNNSWVLWQSRLPLIRTTSSPATHFVGTRPFSDAEKGESPRTKAARPSRVASP